METSSFIFEVNDLYTNEKITFNEKELILDKYRYADLDEKKCLDENYHTMIKNEISSIRKNQESSMGKNQDKYVEDNRPTFLAGLDLANRSQELVKKIEGARLILRSSSSLTGDREKWHNMLKYYETKLEEEFGGYL